MLTYFDACMYSWECDSETMSFSQIFGHNEALNETQLPLYLFLKCLNKTVHFLRVRVII